MEFSDNDTVENNAPVKNRVTTESSNKPFEGALFDDEEWTGTKDILLGTVVEYPPVSVSIRPVLPGSEDTVRTTDVQYEETIDDGFAGAPPVPIPPPVDPTRTPAYVPAATNYGRVATHGMEYVSWSAEAIAFTWDGVTTWNPCVLTKAQVLAGAFGRGYAHMRGLAQVYYATMPFADPAHPTVHEIENWIIITIKHFRALLGYSESTHPLSIMPEMMYTSHWATERKNTTYWDSGYPLDGLDTSKGPCVGGTNGHCGWLFKPSCTDQTPYLMNGDACVTIAPTAEALLSIRSSYKDTIPWSYKFAYRLGEMFNNEGNAGHVPAFLTYPYIGFSLLCTGMLRFHFKGTPGSACP
jgi:hypothetical protein